MRGSRLITKQHDSHSLALLVFVSLVSVIVAIGCGDSEPAVQDAAARPDLGPLALSLEQRLVLRSPDGSERELARADQSNSFPTSPRWSPDGTRIAYIQKTLFTGAGPDWGDDIYIVSADGGDPQLIRGRPQPGQQILGLDWTPDGTALVFGDLEPVYRDGSLQEYKPRIRRLVLDSSSESTVLDDAYQPSLSRDGRVMAYLSGPGNGALHVADMDGENARTVVPLGAFPVLMFPRISPDGMYVAFAAVDPVASRPRREAPSLVDRLLGLFEPARASAHGLPMDVWRIEVATTSLTRLTSLMADEPCPAWSPDGEWLAVLATGGFYQVRLDGSGIATLGPGSFGGQVDVH